MVSASIAISAAIITTDVAWAPFVERPMLIGKTRPATHGRRTSTKVIPK
jgi:hypothetical protein